MGRMRRSGLAEMHFGSAATGTPIQTRPTHGSQGFLPGQLFRVAM